MTGTNLEEMKDAWEVLEQTVLALFWRDPDSASGARSSKSRLATSLVTSTVMVLLVTSVSIFENSWPASTCLAEALEIAGESTVTKSVTGAKVKAPVPTDAKS